MSLKSSLSWFNPYSLLSVPIYKYLERKIFRTVIFWLLTRFFQERVSKYLDRKQMVLRYVRIFEKI